MQDETIQREFYAGPLDGRVVHCLTTSRAIKFQQIDETGRAMWIYYYVDDRTGKFVLEGARPPVQA